jgi:hypothetical protein
MDVVVGLFMAWKRQSRWMTGHSSVKKPPAFAGMPSEKEQRPWIPAFAGMTGKSGRD